MNKFRVHMATLLATLITALPASAENEGSDDDWGVAWRTSYLSVEDSNTIPGIPALNPNNPPLIPKSKIESTYDLLLNDLLVDYRINENFGIYTGLRRAGRGTVPT